MNTHHPWTLFSSLYKPLRQYKDRRNYIQWHKNHVKEINNSTSQIRYYNFWKNPTGQEYWFTPFINSRIHLKNSSKTIGFISCFGVYEAISGIESDIKIYYTGENSHCEFHTNPIGENILKYADGLLNDPNIDLSLGFDYFEFPRYMRFPLWYTYIFDSRCNQEQLLARIKELRYPYIGEREQFCALIASHDWNDIRTNVLSQIRSIPNMQPIKCAGKFMHNDDTLKKGYNDNKCNYLKQFIFNICPENSNSYGYVTEKLFEAILSGCIPIYWGSYNDPEPGVINKDAVLFFDPHKENEKLLQQIEDLVTHPKMLNDFMMQPRLLDSAEEIIIGTLDELQRRIESLVSVQN